MVAVTGRIEIDLAFVDIDPRDPHTHRVTGPVHPARALTGEAVAGRIEVIVVLGQ